MPLLESILQQFPFVILNFHSGNGSEFIDKTVAQLLEKLLIEQTESRPARAATTVWWRLERNQGWCIWKRLPSSRRDPKKRRPSKEFRGDTVSLVLL